MLLLKSGEALRSKLNEYKKDQKSIGFVPTMGALHDGHISLVESSRKENDVTVCSIFVNPAQFNDAKDLEKYPITLEADILKLESARCDIVFLPSRNEIYPAAYAAKHYDLGHLEQIFEGQYRPGHFQGVCQVVEILLRIVLPDKLYLGQKDLQQCKVIDRLLELTGLGNEITMVICPTVREKDGLAMSSRNMRLEPAERKNAVAISKSLAMIFEKWSDYAPAELEKMAREKMMENHLKVDYVAIVDADTLLSIDKLVKKKNVAALAAAFAGEIRLIDNMVGSV